MRALGALVVLAACQSAGPAPVASPPAPAPAPAAPAAPADPPPTIDGDVTEASLHGMQILVKRIPGAEQTATKLYIRGGVTNWGEATAGIELFALDVAASGGTARLPKDAFTERLSALGSSIEAHGTQDFSVLDAWSLTPAWDDTFTLLVDAFRHPALPPSQIELVRARQLSTLKHELDVPDARVHAIAHAGLFKGHPYEHRAVGTLETVGSFTAAQLAAHLAKLRETSRLLLVVVGDVDPTHVIGAASAALGDLPRGSYRPTPLPPLPAPARGSLSVLDQKLPTNYLVAKLAGPTWGDPDLFPALVAMTTLHQREFKEVRTKRNLSYAPAAWLDFNLDIPTATLSVSAVDPIATMKVMLDEARRLRDEPIPARELAGTKATLVTSTFLAGEAPADQASQLGNAQLHSGDWRLARTFPDRVRAVTSAQVQTWAAKHLGRLQTFAIGDPSKIDRAALEAF